MTESAFEDLLREVDDIGANFEWDQIMGRVNQLPASDLDFDDDLPAKDS